VRACILGIFCFPEALPLRFGTDAPGAQPHQSRFGTGIPRKEVHVVSRPIGTNAFEFVVVSALRAAQLMKGCTPRVPAGYKHIVTAQLEVAAGKVAKIIDEPKL
jgi:DNA-directed RNA polymerase subunit K/omega